MKIYAVPAEVPFAETDYSSFNIERGRAREDAHMEALKAHLIKLGYRGPNTGKVLSMHVGDGAARYMLADGPKSFLVHLPYGDAYHSPDAQFLPKAEVLKRIAAAEKVADLFAKGRKGLSGRW